MNMAILAGLAAPVVGAGRVPGVGAGWGARRRQGQLVTRVNVTWGGHSVACLEFVVFFKLVH